MSGSTEILLDSENAGPKKAKTHFVSQAIHTPGSRGPRVILRGFFFVNFIFYYLFNAVKLSPTSSPATAAAATAAAAHESHKVLGNPLSITQPISGVRR